MESNNVFNFSLRNRLATRIYLSIITSSILFTLNAKKYAYERSKLLLIAFKTIKFLLHNILPIWNKRCPYLINCLNFLLKSLINFQFLPLLLSPLQPS